MHVGAYIKCARAPGENVRWCNRGGPARGVRLPLSTPLRYQPWLDIINGNAIFSSAMQFRVPLSRIRSSVLYADLSISPSHPPRLALRSRFLLSLSLSLRLIRAIHLSLPSRTSLRICYFVYFSLVPPTSPANGTSVAFSPLGFRSRRARTKLTR